MLRVNSDSIKAVILKEIFNLRNTIQSKDKLAKNNETRERKGFTARSAEL